jgi:hypothetical protein
VIDDHGIDVVGVEQLALAGDVDGQAMPNFDLSDLSRLFGRGWRRRRRRERRGKRGNLWSGRCGGRHRRLGYSFAARPTASWLVGEGKKRLGKGHGGLQRFGEV